MSQVHKNTKKKIILTKKVRKLGKKGDVLFVKPGYFRNYLSQGHAVIYSEKQLEIIRKNINNSKNDQTQQEFLNIKSQLENKNLYFERQASGMMVLFGSVSKKDISQNIQDTFKINILPSKIFFEQVIKTTGIFKISIDLNDEISFTMNIVIGRTMDEAKATTEETSQEVENGQ